MKKWLSLALLFLSVPAFAQLLMPARQVSYVEGAGARISPTTNTVQGFINVVNTSIVDSATLTVATNIIDRAATNLTWNKYWDATNYAKVITWQHGSNVWDDAMTTMSNHVLNVSNGVIRNLTNNILTSMPNLFQPLVMELQSVVDYDVPDGLGSTNNYAMRATNLIIHAGATRFTNCWVRQTNLLGAGKAVFNPWIGGWYRIASSGFAKGGGRFLVTEDNAAGDVSRHTSTLGQWSVPDATNEWATNAYHASSATSVYYIDDTDWVLHFWYENMGTGETNLNFKWHNVVIEYLGPLN